MSQSKFKVGSLLGSTALVALGVAFAGQATAADHARVVKSSKDQVSLKISGQFSREITVVDDGFSTRVRHADSNYSSSRFRFHASGKINANMKVGGLSEIAIDDNRNAPNNTRGAANNGRSGNDLQTRKTEIFITHNQFGRVWIGAGDPAANGVMNTVTHGIYSALPGFMGLIQNAQYRNEGQETLTGTGLATAHTDLDFNSRRTRVRYDTPVIAGFMASVSHSDGQEIEAALRYSGKIFDSKVKAAMGAAYNTLEGDTITEMYGAQLSFVHSSGLGLTGGCAYQIDEAKGTVGENTLVDNTDPQGCIIQGHFQRKFNELGKTSLVVEYDQKDNTAGDGDTATGIGVTVHQAIDAAAMEVWVKYSNFDLDREGVATDDIDTFTLGTRMKF